LSRPFWTAELDNGFGPSSLSPLPLSIFQTGGTLSGTSRVNTLTGTIDAAGNVTLKVITPSNQTLVTFIGRVSGSGSSQSVSGSYSAMIASPRGNVPENGTFVWKQMTI